MITTTSGSDIEIEQRFLLKGNIVAARNSLFDLFLLNSWIKKSNYEGIFNAMLTIFVMVIIHKPVVRLIQANSGRATGSEWVDPLSPG